MRRAILRKLLLIPFILFCHTAEARIVASSLTTGQSATNATSYTSASITPTAKALVLLAVWSDVSSGPPVTPTATGNSLTWTVINSDTNSSDTTRRLTLFRAQGSSPTSGQITIDFGAETQRCAMWSVAQLTGVLYVQDGGSEAVFNRGLETSTGFGTSDTIVLANFQRQQNSGFGAYIHGTNEATTPGAGCVEINDQNINDAGLISGLQMEYTQGTPTLAWSWATSSLKFGVAIEVVAAPTEMYGPQSLYNGTIY